MSAGFGFSVGDFIAAIRLVGTVTDALRNAQRAGREFADIVQLLSTLEVCLINVKEIVLENPGDPHGALLHRAVAQCQRTIHAFWKQVQKYQPHLQSTEHSSKLRDSWMKVRWALCKQEDVARFKAEIQCQVIAIELALTTLQLQRQGRGQRNASRMADDSRHCVEQLATLTAQARCEAERSACFLDRSDTIVQQNQLLLSMLEERQDRLLKLPAQIERQQPVYLRDALDKDAPFHLEFVRSAEALLCVLRINLAHTRAGPEKLDRGEFSITASGSNRPINLSQPWEACFFPGQRVGMSMLFYLPRRPAWSCPACSECHHEYSIKETQCFSCGTTYQILKIGMSELRQNKTCRELVDRRTRKDDASEEQVHSFRRIQVIDVVPDESPTPTGASKAAEASHSTNRANDAAARYSSRSKGCIRVVERQTLCHCILHEHSVDHTMPCTCLGNPRRALVKEVLVAYACPEHPAPSDAREESHAPIFSGPGRPGHEAGDIPTPPSSLPEEATQMPPGIPSDARRGACELETPPETPESAAQAESDQMEPAPFDLSAEAAVHVADDVGAGSARLLAQESHSSDECAYVPKTLPVAIPVRAARAGQAGGEESSRSWEAGFGRA